MYHPRCRPRPGPRGATETHEDGKAVHSMLKAYIIAHQHIQDTASRHESGSLVPNHRGVEAGSVKLSRQLTAINYRVACIGIYRAHVEGKAPDGGPGGRNRRINVEIGRIEAKLCVCLQVRSQSWPVVPIVVQVDGGPGIELERRASFPGRTGGRARERPRNRG